MGFKDTMSKWGKSLQNTAGDVSEKAKILAEKTKIKSKISTEESTIRSKYIELGKKAYEMMKENPSEEFAEFVQDINTSFKEIEKLNVELVALDGTGKCANCGAEIGKDESFCSKCGSKIVAPEPKSEDVIEVPEEMAEDTASAIPVEAPTIPVETSTIPTETTSDEIKTEE